jgi:hypothetical protein
LDGFGSLGVSVLSFGWPNTKPGQLYLWYFLEQFVIATSICLAISMLLLFSAISVLLFALVLGCCLLYCFSFFPSGVVHLDQCKFGIDQKAIGMFHDSLAKLVKKVRAQRRPWNWDRIG